MIFEFPPEIASTGGNSHSTLGVFPIKPLPNGVFALGSGFFYIGSNTANNPKQPRK